MHSRLQLHFGNVYDTPCAPGFVYILLNARNETPQTKHFFICTLFFFFFFFSFEEFRFFLFCFVFGGCLSVLFILYFNIWFTLLFSFIFFLSSSVFIAMNREIVVCDRFCWSVRCDWKCTLYVVVVGERFGYQCFYWMEWGNDDDDDARWWWWWWLFVSGRGCGAACTRALHDARTTMHVVVNGEQMRETSLSNSPICQNRINNIAFFCIVLRITRN